VTRRGTRPLPHGTGDGAPHAFTFTNLRDAMRTTKGFTAA
jgi:hypothetical protein